MVSEEFEREIEIEELEELWPSRADMGEECRHTTAIYPNRVKDKERLEAMGFEEWPEWPNTRVFTKLGMLISNDYVRIVFGDHGPYIEIDPKDVAFDNFTFKKKSDLAWYDEWYSKDDTKTMLYAQKRDVKMLPNPPKGKYSFRGNRSEGYADYKVGMIYVDPDKVSLE